MAGSVKDLIVRLLVDDEDLDKVDQSKARFDKWSDGLDVAAQGSTVALGIIAGAGVGVAATFAGVEAAGDQMAASLGLTEAQAAVAGEAAANAYGNAFGSSREEVNAATAGIVSSIAGMRDASVEELQGITEKVLTISTGLEVEADRISQVVGQMISTGLVSSAGEGLDLLTAALQQVPAAVREDVLDAVDEYGPFFAGIGMDGEAAMSALVAASEKGMYGIDKTGDAVKEFSIRATDMSTASVAAYEAAGLSAEDMAAKILAGGEQGKQGFLQVVDGLLGIEDPVARANAAIGLFGTPLEDLGVNEIPQFLDALADSAGGMGEFEGAAGRMADTMGGNVKSKWTEIQRSFEDTAVELGESLLPVIEDVTEGFGGFADWASQNTGVIMAIATVVGIVASGIILASTAMKIFAVAQAIQTAAQWASNAAWLASPITWIILAIIVAVGLLVLAGIWLVQNWDGVISWITTAWTGFMSWISDAINLFVLGWNLAWSTVGRVISDIWNNWIVTPIRNAIDWVNMIVSTGLTVLRLGWESVWNGILTTVKNIWNGIIGFIEGGVNGAIDLINGMTGGLRDVAGFIGIEVGPIPHIRIPRLALGTVTNGPMLAMVGDNPGGREVIQPVSTYQDELRRAYAAGSDRGSTGPMRLAREDLEYLASLLGQTVYPLIMSGAQKTVRAAFGG